MKQTANRGYPYPECNPPFVKDTADLPLQLKNFAELADDDVTMLAALAADALNPPAAKMNSAVGQVLSSGQPFDFSTTAFANPASMADLTVNQLLIPNGGLYLVIGYSDGVSGGSVTAQELSILVNGAIVRTASATDGTSAVNNVTFHGPLQAGDMVTMSQRFTGVATVTYNSLTYLSAVRLVKL